MSPHNLRKKGAKFGADWSYLDILNVLVSVTLE